MKKLILSSLILGALMLFVGNRAECQPVGWFTTSSTGVLVSTTSPLPQVLQICVSTGLATSQVILIDTDPTKSSTGGVITSPLSFGGLSGYDKGQHMHPPILLTSTGSTSGNILQSVQCLSFPKDGVMPSNGIFIYQSATGANVTVYLQVYGYFRGAKWIDENEAMREANADFERRGIKVSWNRPLNTGLEN